MGTQTDSVVQFIQKVSWEDIPEHVKHQSKRCLLDALGAMLAGMKTPVGDLMTDIAQSQFSGNEATILVSGKRASAAGAVLANGFAGNALDIDDGYRLIKGHPGACVLPVALAAGELTASCSGKDFLTALIVGYEIGIRAGLIRHATYETYHSSGSWGAIAGAAAAGKILGLDNDKLIHAMGSAEYHAPIAPMMKGIATPSMGKDSIGWGAMVAMLSVMMAQKGFTGITPIFDDTPDVKWIESLGCDYEIMNLYFKPYSACRWGQPAVDGALDIMREYNLTAAEVDRIRVCTFAEAAALSVTYPENTEDAQYNMAFPIAAAILDREIGPRQVLPPRLFDADIRQMMDRVEVVAEDRFQNAFPQKALSEVIILTTDGREIKSGIMSARWDLSGALPTDDELKQKFRWLVKPVLGKDKSDELMSMIFAFEKLTDVCHLIKGCC